MSNYAADDTQAIAQRLKEIEAEKKVALTGTSAPVDGKEEKQDPPSWGYGGGIDYCALKQQHELAIATSPIGGLFAPMKSPAHPEWPYANTGFEWRRFVRS